MKRKEKIELLKGIASGTKTIEDLNTLYRFQYKYNNGTYTDSLSDLVLSIDEIYKRFVPDKWNIKPNVYWVDSKGNSDGIPYSIFVERKQ